MLAALYGYLVWVSLGNLLLMPKPKPSALKENTLKIVALIPARNEAENLAELLPQLTPFVDVIVFDDESSDGTGDVARQLGAQVITPPEPLPAGWTGKNRACHELGLAGSQTPADYLLFLDADVRVTEQFFPVLQEALKDKGTGCFTGFPYIVPGRFPQPLFLAWVGWILLATIPFGVIQFTKIGHSRFTNGQITLWKKSIWNEIRPNETARNRVLEDVVIGRLLAAKGVRTTVLRLPHVLSTKMYETWRETIDGMSKNSFEIMNSYIGTVLLAALLLFVSWGWVIWLPGYALLCLSGILALGCCLPSAKHLPLLLATSILMPIMISIGAFTLLRSLYWKAKKKTAWKGRIYS